MSTIGPLVASSRARLGLIPDATWQEPYMVGFLSMLIVLVAMQHARRRIGSDQLALLQMETFSRITGVRDDRIGEQICFLSAASDEDFLNGCRNALFFLKAYNGDPDIGDICDAPLLGDGALAEISQDEAAAFGSGGLIATLLWRRYFDSRVR